MAARRELLPPLDRGPRALAAAARLAGALGAGEELCNQLGDVGKLGVGAQHVHGLLDFLKRQQDKCNSCGIGELY